MPVTLLVPAFNEEDVIERLAGAVLPVLGPDWELLVVDDGSTDRTPELLRAMASRDERVRILVHESNLGMGAAIATGFRAAAGRVIVTMDADLSHPVELVPRLVEACGDADAAFASRYVPGGGMDAIPWRRAAISRLANRALTGMFATRVRDLTTGFRAYRAETVRDLDLVGTGFETQLEISIRLVAAGRRIVEVPLQLGPRAGGASKMRYLRLVRPYARTVAGMARLRWGRRGARRATGRAHP